MNGTLTRPHELWLHLNDAPRNGPPCEEICEIFLYVTVYCGVPAGIDSTRIADETIAEFDAEAARNDNQFAARRLGAS